LWSHAFGYQAVGDLIGSAIELTKGDAPSLKMDRHAVGSVPGVMARDIADGLNIRRAIDLQHGDPPHFCFVFAAMLCIAVILEW
jgi:hypothetical protein